MDPGLVFRRISAALDSSDIPYMLTGSFASSYYEALRSTHDIDVVIAPTSEQLEYLVYYLREHNYHADLELALPAYREQSMFNVFDHETGWKIDFFFRKSRAFSLEEFRRRKETIFEGVHLFVATAEDVILAKLEWAKIGESHRQVEDAAIVLKKQQKSLDRKYLDTWASALGVQAELLKALQAAGLH